MIWKNSKQRKSRSEETETPSAAESEHSQENAGDGDDKDHRPAKEAPSSKKHHRIAVFGSAAVVIVLLAALVTLSLIRSVHLRQDAQRRAVKAGHGQFVEVAEAQKSPSIREIQLIGEARPYLTDNLYARVSGYVREVNFDKGDRVRHDQVLAVVESPETDRAYLGALADFQNKERIAKRMRLLLKRKLIAPQDAEIAIAAADIARATLETQEVLKSYEQVRAPFDGIVTSRLVDPGNLIQSATNSQSGQQLLATISQTDRLRVYVFVDQKDATFIKVGDPATVSLEERSDLKIDGQITRVAGELDARTRKMLTEIDLPNTDRPIVSGSFVKVKITLEAPSYPLVPVKALVVRGNKPFVPVLSMDNTVHFQPVEILDNDGQTLRIGKGISAGMRVAIDLGNTVAEGAKVRPQPMAGEIHQAPPYPGAEANATVQPRQASGQAPGQAAPTLGPSAAPSGGPSQ